MPAQIAVIIAAMMVATSGRARMVGGANHRDRKSRSVARLCGYRRAVRAVDEIPSGAAKIRRPILCAKRNSIAFIRVGDSQGAALLLDVVALLQHRGRAVASWERRVKEVVLDLFDTLVKLEIPLGCRSGKRNGTGAKYDRTLTVDNWPRRPKALGSASIANPSGRPT